MEQTVVLTISNFTTNIGSISSSKGNWFFYKRYLLFCFSYF
nr:MAG TPA: hypothetical protein [Caudoviricetes sp.]DAH26162.1 MAG TPA: hypothetical protein [Bacteriophage sp.]